MGNTTRNRRPLQPVHGKARWLRRPGVYDNLSGLLEINDQPYGLLIHETAYELTKLDGNHYHLPRDLSSCDCPDGTYCCERPGGCKHRKALAALLRAAGL